ncbi:MAG: hypothetical protein ACODAA_00310 [Gemmatimonadota bacterium]
MKRTHHRRSGSADFGGRRFAFLTLVPIVGVLALALASPATAQERYDGDPDRPIITPSTPDPFMPVHDVELVSPRIDGPPALVLFTEAGKLHPAAGTYRSRDGKAVMVSKAGQIVELADREAETGRFQVATIEKVAVRMDAPPRLVLRDDRGRKLALPDGRYLNQEEVTLAVRDGTIVGYGRSR